MLPSPSGASRVKRGPGPKYPRPADCPHLDRPEHSRGACYPCTSHRLRREKLAKKQQATSDTASNLSISTDSIDMQHDLQLQVQHALAADQLASLTASAQDLGEPVGNGKRKHSDGATPKAKKRKLGGRLPDPAVLDLNVGGTLFTTTLHTLNREMSLLSQWAVGQESPRYDTEGRLFIDRDPTHFRYILNYLRDQYLVSMPSALHDRLELLHEARYYHLHGLCTLLEHQHQQQAAQQAGSGTAKEVPSFLNSRPSTKGLFYINDPNVRWHTVFETFASKRSWQWLAVKFDEVKLDEVTLYNLVLGDNPSSEVIQAVKLVIDRAGVARATVTVEDDAPTEGPANAQTADITLWFESSPTSTYPQLFIRFMKGEAELFYRPLDFYRLVHDSV